MVENSEKIRPLRNWLTTRGQGGSRSEEELASECAREGKYVEAVGEQEREK